MHNTNNNNFNNLLDNEKIIITNYMDNENNKIIYVSKEYKRNILLSIIFNTVVFLIAVIIYLYLMYDKNKNKKNVEWIIK